MRNDNDSWVEVTINNGMNKLNRAINNSINKCINRL
jgi:hypothetical protein